MSCTYRTIRYLLQVTRHKWFVFLEAWKLGIPMLGILHDWSKFRPSELISYAKYFSGGKSPNDEEHGVDLDVAWNHHQKRNKHHWQYWVLRNDTTEPLTIALPMPERYVREMIADWRGAGRAYGNPDTLAWYRKYRDRQILHPKTRCKVEELLGIRT